MNVNKNINICISKIDNIGISSILDFSNYLDNKLKNNNLNIFKNAIIPDLENGNKHVHNLIILSKDINRYIKYCYSK